MRAMKLKILALVLIVLGIAFTACTGGQSEVPDEADHVAVHAAAADPQLVEIRSRDYAFDAPDTIAAGLTTLRLYNDGADIHHVWLVRLEEGKTMNDLLAALQTSHALPEWAVDVGGPNLPGGPGAYNDATLKLEAGNYVMLCVIPAADGMPHVMKGMVRPITVVDRGQPDAPLPPADIVMTLDDYKFETNIEISAGVHTIRIENAARQSHEVVAMRLLPGKTAQDLLAWSASPAGPPPAVPVTGITGIARGEVNQVTADFTPGEYVLVCFWPDVTDGKPHFAHGMIRQFTVS
jgi:hypothetical protein